ncbi:MAG: hypothetical protein AB7J28_16595 [Hyphomonadaceae bacterium]
MRGLILLCALALAACAPPQQQTGTQSAQQGGAVEAANPGPLPAPAEITQGCGAERTRTLSYFGYQQPLTLTARADGPSCPNAVVTLVLRDPAGRPLWVLAGPYHGLATLGDPEMLDDPVSRDDVALFLDRWVQPTQNRTGEMPDWPETAASLQEAEGPGIIYFTPHGRETYLALRQHNLPMLCFINAWESSECLIIDPASHMPSVFVRFGS